MVMYLKAVVRKFLNDAHTYAKWRRKNRHNLTEAGVVDGLSFPIDKVTVGAGTYGILNVYSYGSDDERLNIGSYCSIAGQVSFILGGMHKYDHITTFPFKKIYRGVTEAYSKGTIVVEDDVWIGFGCTLLSGVTIGRGSIVAAGSVVVKSTEPYSIYGGNPAKFIKYRFTEEVIRGALIDIDYTKLNVESVDYNSLYTTPTPENVKNIVAKINNNE